MSRAAAIQIESSSLPAVDQLGLVVVSAAVAGMGWPKTAVAVAAGCCQVAALGRTVLLCRPTAALVLLLLLLLALQCRQEMVLPRLLYKRQQKSYSTSNGSSGFGSYCGSVLASTMWITIVFVT